MLYGKDTLRRKIFSEGSVAENGDFIPGEETWSDAVQCDAKPNDKARVIRFEGGEATSYQYEIFLDVNTPELKYGDRVALMIDGKETEHTVLGFHRYAFQSKAWV